MQHFPTTVHDNYVLELPILEHLPTSCRNYRYHLEEPEILAPISSSLLKT